MHDASEFQAKLNDLADFSVLVHPLESLLESLNRLAGHELVGFDSLRKDILAITDQPEIPQMLSKATRIKQLVWICIRCIFLAGKY
jgi:hypothetical protein